jgi:hypothetical protein
MMSEMLMKAKEWTLTCLKAFMIVGRIPHNPKNDFSGSADAERVGATNPQLLVG